ncbi:tyrosine--tRNA ligase [bacterium]|nr:tyrosine--tRNA ligase [bacterium]
MTNFKQWLGFADSPENLSSQELNHRSLPRIPFEIKPFGAEPLALRSSWMTMNFYAHMEERGLIEQTNDAAGLSEALKLAADKSPRDYPGVYCGFDPTAKSLTLGHLVPLLGLRRAQDHGLRPIVLFGGATGLIGDPTGRTDMRPMNTQEDIAGYIANFTQLVGRYFRFDVPNTPVFVNNIDWIGPMTWLDFARNVGVHFTVAKLLSADVNKSRLEHGLTFMEMGYQLLQSFDFLELFRKYNCILQTGGNDQWSNLLGGTDLIRRVEHKHAFCFTQPLIVDSQGRKLGKTSGNAIWLDPSMTSPYEFFQYLRNIPDENLEQTLRQLTFLPLSEIRTLCSPETNPNKAKERLAWEVTHLVHGKEEADKALAAAHALFEGGGDLSAAPRVQIAVADVNTGLDVVSLLAKVGVCPSKSEARRLVQGNGLLLNGEKCADVNYKLQPADFKHECGGLLIRKGKKDYTIVELN